MNLFNIYQGCWSFNISLKILDTFAALATSLCLPLRSVFIWFITELLPPIRIDKYSTFLPEILAVAWICWILGIYDVGYYAAPSEINTKTLSTLECLSIIYLPSLKAGVNFVPPPPKIIWAVLKLLGSAYSQTDVVELLNLKMLKYWFFNLFWDEIALMFSLIALTSSFHGFPYIDPD